MQVLSDGNSKGLALFYVDSNNHLREVILTKDQMKSIDTLLGIALKGTTIHAGKMIKGYDDIPLVVKNVIEEESCGLRKPTPKQMAWIRDIEEAKAVPKFDGKTIKDAERYITKWKDADDEIGHENDWAISHGYI